MTDNFKLERWDPKVHAAAVGDWLSRWSERLGEGLIPKGHLDTGLLPSSGWVAPGLAACFVYITNSDVAFIDVLVSNPDADRGLVDPALDAVALECQADALAAGCRRCVAFSRVPAVVDRVTRRHGYESAGDDYTILMRTF